MTNQTTHHSAFWIPILTSVDRDGGSARSDEVYAYIASAVPLNDYDLTIMGGTAPEPYWHQRVRVAILRMRERGLIESSQAHGVYHISQKGKAFLLENLPSSMQSVLADTAERLREEGIFDPTGLMDARERILGSIVRRGGQPAFRKALLTAYDGRCAITGCDVEAVLDAAHIVPYMGPETNHPGNGLLLRTDLHSLFDLGLLAIDPTTMTVLISRSLDGTCYDEYRRRPVSLPDDVPSQPSRDALEQHRQASGLTRT